MAYRQDKPKGESVQLMANNSKEEKNRELAKDMNLVYEPGTSVDPPHENSGRYIQYLADTIGPEELNRRAAAARNGVV